MNTFKQNDQVSTSNELIVRVRWRLHSAPLSYAIAATALQHTPPLSIACPLTHSLQQLGPRGVCVRIIQFTSYFIHHIAKLLFMQLHEVPATFLALIAFKLLDANRRSANRYVVDVYEYFMTPQPRINRAGQLVARIVHSDIPIIFADIIERIGIESLNDCLVVAYRPLTQVLVWRVEIRATQFT